MSLISKINFVEVLQILQKSLSSILIMPKTSNEHHNFNQNSNVLLICLASLYHVYYRIKNIYEDVANLHHVLILKQPLERTPKRKATSILPNHNNCSPFQLDVEDNGKHDNKIQWREAARMLLYLEQQLLPGHGKGERESFLISYTFS